MLYRTADSSNRLTTRRVYDGDGNRKSRRKWVAGATALLLMGGGSAFGVWVTEGSGSSASTQTTGTATTLPITVVADSLTSAITPGGTAGVVAARITNTQTVAVNINSVVVSVTGTSAGASCPSSDFTVTQGTYVVVGTNAVVSFPYVVPASGQIATDGSLTGEVPATVSLVAAAPTACEAVTVNLLTTVS